MTPRAAFGTVTDRLKRQVRVRKEVNPMTWTDSLTFC